MDVRTGGCSCGIVNCGIGVEGLVGFTRGQVGQIDRGRCRRTKRAGGESAGHGNRIRGVEMCPAVAMMRIPRLNFPSPAEDPVLAKTDVDSVTHPDIELELSIHAFRAV